MGGGSSDPPPFLWARLHWREALSRLPVHG